MGSIDIGTAPADSGGPYFIGGLIAGVHNYSDGAVNPVGAVNGWGTIAEGARVSVYVDDFITPVAKNGRSYAADKTIIDPADKRYDLVFDMNYQVYGKSGPAGVADKTPENLTITAMLVGDQLHIWVDNLDNPGLKNPLNGPYYTAPAENIKSLTIRGSTDNETIRLAGDFLLPGGKRQLPDGITIEGGGGADEVIYDDGGAAAVAHNYTFGKIPADWDLRLNRWSAVAGDLSAIDAKGISKFTLRSSPGVDTVRVEEVSKLANGLFIDTGPVRISCILGHRTAPG